MDDHQPKRFQFTLRAWLGTIGLLALGFLWPPALPVLVWLVLFLGPLADRRRNLVPVLSLAAAFYLPALLCVVASEQSRWQPHFAWDQVARDYLWASPCLPGFLSALPVANVLQTTEFHFISQVAMGVSTLMVLALFTWLARLHVAVRIFLVQLALTYSFFMSLGVPAGMRM
jgi:hypothetical protein